MSSILTLQVLLIFLIAQSNWVKRYPRLYSLKPNGSNENVLKCHFVSQNYEGSSVLSGLAPKKAALPPPKTVNPLVARNETTFR